MYERQRDDSWTVVRRKRRPGRSAAHPLQQSHHYGHYIYLWLWRSKHWPPFWGTTDLRGSGSELPATPAPCSIWTTIRTTWQQVCWQAPSTGPGLSTATWQPLLQTAKRWRHAPPWCQLFPGAKQTSKKWTMTSTKSISTPAAPPTDETATPDTIWWPRL